MASDSVKSKRKKYDSNDTKRRLVRAAVATFSKVGYDAATTREIADAAGVNEALIHRYFKNKLGLFFATLHEFNQHLEKGSPYPMGDTVEEEISNFIGHRLELYRKERRFIRLGLTRAILDPKVRDEIQLKFKQTPVLASRLRALQERGKLRADISVEELCHLILSIAFSMGLNTHIIFHQDRAFIDRVLKLATSLLGRSLSPGETRAPCV